MDQIFGTRFEGSEMEKKIRAREEKSSKKEK
jgi:hypothetical protein